MTIDNIVMRETRHSIVDWVYSKTQTLRATLKTQNQPQGESCVFSEVEHLFPVSWMCKKQNAVSHSSTESEVISLDAGLRMDGLPLDLWDMVIEVSSSTTHTVQPNHNCIRESCAKPNSTTKTQKVERRQKVHQLSDVDYVTTDTHSSYNESQLYIF